MLGISSEGDVIRGCFAKRENAEVQNNCYHQKEPSLLTDDLKKRVEFMHELAVNTLDSSSSAEARDLLDAIYLELKEHKKMNWAQELIRRSFASWIKAQGKDELLMCERVLRVAILDQLRKCEPTNKFWRAERGKMQHSIIDIELPGKRKKVTPKFATNISPRRSNGYPSIPSLSIALDLCIEPLVEVQQMYHNIRELKLEESKLKDQVTELRSELNKVKTDGEKAVEVLKYKCCHYRRLVFLKGQESFEMAKRVEELLELEKSYNELRTKYQDLSKLVGVSMNKM
ncbi:hypothetical protein O6H91_11G017200 [Diphasiastrum complanatum]|nr:hypothetical protein O6H91_11G017200 [Diphasiastrum complanatum]